jgi:hypothetical protein
MSARASANIARTIKNLKKAHHIITPRLDAWLGASPELVVETPEEEALMLRLLSKPRGSRVGVWTGSQATTCERKQVFNFMGVHQLARYDPRLLNLFHDGTWRHVRWQLMLSKAIPGFEAELPTSVTTMNFLGAIDGGHPTELWGFELKGTSAFPKVVQNGVMEAHREQAERYWISTEADPAFPVFNEWVFVYEDKRTQEWREIVVQRDATIERRVRREFQRLNDAVTQENLPPVLPGCKRGVGREFKQCPYADRCLTIASWEDAQAQTAVAGPTGTGGTTKRGRPAPQPVVVGKRRKLEHH